MITFHIFCTDKLKSDIIDKKVDFVSAEVKMSGKNLLVNIEKMDLDTLSSIIDIIHKYGVSSQEDHDDISVEEEDILRNY
jgi:predicted AAA+ superfamily ATPase